MIIFVINQVPLYITISDTVMARSFDDQEIRSLGGRRSSDQTATMKQRSKSDIKTCILKVVC
uniref:Uncharacterized protein n=1 Tax=Arion vulgaris TaxID=1028688 RepID=A0A0B7AAG0_9EUPU